ncbi:uncharacterized protein LOC125504757 [Dendroctonus ponderosae]|uniref:uncharacterized protein LOC125504757 n=1 Tax=Dendroctonus ponderosae TaxID=77166 RepID=UPI002035BC4A|nr:uncharacterized protein LOC125504757 [Dendroctonus ponderosae]
MCDEAHFLPEKMEKLTRVEIIEYLRISHEEIYEIVLLFQQFTSPQLLACIVVEVSILIINIYSAMVYLMYQSDKVITTSTFALNCIYVVAHFIGFFWFFKNINNLMRIVQGLKPILIACSLSAQTDEEHQQFRIFVNKVTNQRPFSMNDFFNADLGIMGPVIGSILTYLLVALQFDIPAQEHNN